MTRHCFERDCSAPATHRARVIVRAEKGERVDIMARITLPAVFCRQHATTDGLSARHAFPPEHLRRITRDLQRIFGGIPIDWDRSVVQFTHRWLAWLWSVQ